MGVCICNPITEKDRFDLEHYGCPEEICPGCYGGKEHDDPYCKECMDFLEHAKEEIEEIPIVADIAYMEQMQAQDYDLPEPTKILYLMQGVPGSGKTTVAKMIREHHNALGDSTALISTDSFRFDDEGVYIFDAADNARYHKMAQKECIEEMANRDTNIIIIDNTNIQEWQAHPYLVMAEIYGYLVQVISVDSGLALAIERQQERRVDRQVPAGVIIRMYNDMERILANPNFMPKEMP